MNERIEKLTELTLKGKMYPMHTEAEYNRMDMFLPEHIMQARRIHDYILAQEPVLTEYQTMTGAFTFDWSGVVGDAFMRAGHKGTHAIMSAFYLKPIDNLVTMEWQHATADFNRVIRLGIRGLIKEIEESKLKYKDDKEKIDYLEALKIVAEALIKWAHKCSSRAKELAERIENSEYKRNLLRLAETLKKIPEKPAESFYEAVLSIYMFFSCDPDSLGTLDRTLYAFYINDIESGAITVEEAKLCLQELFLMLQSKTLITGNFTRGGESHFCVGGYTADHEDFFNDFSLLILEAMLELPTYIPQASLRWTKKLDFNRFMQVLELLRKDKNNRIALVNDEIKIHSFMEIAHMSFEDACSYTSVGCNEVAFPGGMVGGTTESNILHSVESMVYNRTADIIQAQSFDELWEIYRQELFKDIDLMLYYEDQMNLYRAKDTNYISSLIFADCIKKAESFTKGVVEKAISGPALLGVVNVIDSLSVIKQFVYDEKAFSMEELISALKNNWQGYEDMLTLIKKRADFFGNDGDISNYVARLFTDTLYEYTKDKTSVFGYHLIMGNLEGYHPHHEWFGEKMRATPDGRHNGEMIKFGLSQNGGYDREGLSALLNSVAKCDKHGIISGNNSVTNINLDKKLITDDNNFLKTARAIEAYFISGGSQLQINYICADELKKAKITPEEYKNIRVRVSGFSDFFVNLPEGLQDDVISRTEISK